MNIPTDEQIKEAIANTTHSIDDIKNFALKALCDFYTCSSAEQILIKLGLFNEIEEFPGHLDPTRLGQDSVWEWHKKGNV